MGRVRSWGGGLLWVRIESRNRAQARGQHTAWPSALTAQHAAEARQQPHTRATLRELADSYAGQSGDDFKALTLRVYEQSLR